MTHVLIVGSTGYLGRHLVAASVARGWRVSALMRSERHRAAFERMGVRVVLAEATDASTLEGVMSGVDVVISALGITRQKDGLRYMDVDYQANVNVLEAAQEAGVGRMVYIATFRGAQLKEKSEMVCAKERFVARLRDAEIQSTVIRPTGFFSDMGEFVTMAERGRVWLIGDGEQLLNPIDGEDLAQCVLRSIEDGAEEVCVGGPERLSFNEIAALAFEAVGTAPRVTHFPQGLTGVMARVLPWVTPQSVYGPMEMFLAASALDMVAPAYGTRTLKSYFEQMAQSLSRTGSHA